MMSMSTAAVEQVTWAVACAMLLAAAICFALRMAAFFVECLRGSVTPAQYHVGGGSASEPTPPRGVWRC
jgi:hypothetical protein